MTILVKVATQVSTILLKLYYKMMTYQSKWTVMLEYGEYNVTLLHPASWQFNKDSTKIYPTWRLVSKFTLSRCTSILLKTNQLSTIN